MHEKVSSLRSVFFLLWAQALADLALTYRHTEYAGSKEGYKLHTALTAEGSISHTAMRTEDRSKIYELFKNHGWSLTWYFI